MARPELDMEGESARERADYESSPLTRSEYIAAIVHLYRGELYRANAWRLRLDHTTNWAVLTTAGLLSFSFGGDGRSHWTLVVGFGLLTVFLVFEARRFRFADVWRARVRKIEENFYGPILRRDPCSPEERWGELVAEDLFQPRFKITRLQALRARFLRNYLPIYAVLLAAWFLHVLLMPEPAHSWGEVRQHLAEGLVPWWLPVVVLGTVVLAGAGLALGVRRARPEDLDAWRGPEKLKQDRLRDL